MLRVQRGPLGLTRNQCLSLPAESCGFQRTSSFSWWRYFAAIPRKPGWSLTTFNMCRGKKTLAMSPKRSLSKIGTQGPRIQKRKLQWKKRQSTAMNEVQKLFRLDPGRVIPKGQTAPLGAVQVEVTIAKITTITTTTAWTTTITTTTTFRRNSMGKEGITPTLRAWTQALKISILKH